MKERAYFLGQLSIILIGFVIYQIIFGEQRAEIWQAVMPSYVTFDKSWFFFASVGIFSIIGVCGSVQKAEMEAGRGNQRDARVLYKRSGFFAAFSLIFIGLFIGSKELFCLSVAYLSYWISMIMTFQKTLDDLTLEAAERRAANK